MANGFALPPWLTRPTDPVGAFQRSTQIVGQQAQARAELEQRAAEAAQRAALASAEMAQQAQFQQAAQRLKEQGIKADIESEAARLRLGQEAEKRKGQEAANLYRTQSDYERRVEAGEDPRKVLLELGPRMFGSAAGLEALTRPPVDLSKLGTAEPVYGGQGELLGHRIPTSGRGTVFRSTVPDTTAALAKKEETKRVGKKEEISARRLLAEETALRKRGPGTVGWKLIEKKPQEQQQWYKEYQAVTNAIGQLYQPAVHKEQMKGEILTPSPAPGKAQARLNLANQLKASNPDWSDEKIIAEARKQIP